MNSFKANKTAKMPKMKAPTYGGKPYSGKGTKARLNTAASKMFFSSTKGM